MYTKHFQSDEHGHLHRMFGKWLAFLCSVVGVPAKFAHRHHILTRRGVYTKLYTAHKVYNHVIP